MDPRIYPHSFLDSWVCMEYGRHFTSLEMIVSFPSTSTRFMALTDVWHWGLGKHFGSGSIIVAFNTSSSTINYLFLKFHKTRSCSGTAIFFFIYLYLRSPPACINYIGYLKTGTTTSACINVCFCRIGIVGEGCNCKRVAAATTRTSFERLQTPMFTSYCLVSAQE